MFSCICFFILLASFSPPYFPLKRYFTQTLLGCFGIFLSSYIEVDLVYCGRCESSLPQDVSISLPQDLLCISNNVFYSFSLYVLSFLFTFFNPLSGSLTPSAFSPLSHYRGFFFPWMPIALLYSTFSPPILHSLILILLLDDPVSL